MNACLKQRTSENYAAGYGNLDKFVRQGVLPVFHFTSCVWCPGAPDIMLRNSSTSQSTNKAKASNKIFMPSMQPIPESTVEDETTGFNPHGECRVKIDDQHLPCFYHVELCQK